MPESNDDLKNLRRLIILVLFYVGSIQIFLFEKNKKNINGNNYASKRQHNNGDYISKRKLKIKRPVEGLGVDIFN